MPKVAQMNVQQHIHYIIYIKDRKRSIFSYALVLNTKMACLIIFKFYCRLLTVNESQVKVKSVTFLENCKA